MLTGLLAVMLMIDFVSSVALPDGYSSTNLPFSNATGDCTTISAVDWTQALNTCEIIGLVQFVSSSYLC